MVTTYRERSLAARLFALLLLVTVLGAVYSASSLREIEASQKPSVSITLDGSMMFGVTTAVVAGGAPVLFSSIGDTVAFGAPSVDGVVSPQIGEWWDGAWEATKSFGGALWEGVQSTAKTIWECDTIPFAIIPGGDSPLEQFGDCFGAIAQLAGTAIGEVLTMAMVEVFRAINAAARRAYLFMINFMLTEVIGGDNDTVGPGSDYQHGAAAPNLNAGWFQQQFGLSQTIALYLILPLFMVAIIQSIAKGSLFFLIRAATIMLPAAIIGGYAVIEFTRRLLWVSDDLSQAIGSNISTDGAMYYLSNAMNTYRGDMFGLFVFFWFILGFAAGLVVWMELLLRQLGVYIAAFFLPLAFAALVWPATARFARRLVELLIGLIFVKVLIVAGLALGLAGMGKPDMAIMPQAPSAETNLDGANANPAPVSGDMNSAVASPAPGDTVGNITTNGNAQMGPAASLAVMTQAVTIFCGVAMSSTKFIKEIGPGMESLAQNALGNGPAGFWNRGHVANYALGKLNSGLRRSLGNNVPKGQKPTTQKRPGGGSTPPTTSGKPPQPALPSGGGGSGQPALPAGGGGREQLAISSTPYTGSSGSPDTTAAQKATNMPHTAKASPAAKAGNGAGSKYGKRPSPSSNSGSNSKTIDGTATDGHAAVPSRPVQNFSVTSAPQQPPPPSVKGK